MSVYWGTNLIQEKIESEMQKRLYKHLQIRGVHDPMLVYSKKK